MNVSAHRVLLIEDSASDALLLKSSLKTSTAVHFDVVHAASLEEGLTRATEDLIDVVLLDLSLPDSFGMETFDRFASRFPALPVVVLSGLNDEQTALLSVQRGAQDYLVKGRDNSSVVLRSLTYAVQRARINQEIREQEEKLRLISEQLPAVIWTTDRELRLTSFAGAAQEEMKVSPADAIGKTVPEFFDVEANDVEWTQAHSAAVAGQPQTRDIRWRDRYLHVHVESFRDRAGKLLGTIGVALDITDQHEVDVELNLTRRVQEDLRPRRPPALEGFDIDGASYSKSAAGGDYIDYFQLADDSLGLVVCDVGGHGLGPAMLMCQTRAYLRALGTSESDPGKLLTRVNRFLCEDSRETRIVPLIMAKLRPSLRALSYASAGQRGIVVHENGQTTYLDYTGIPLHINDAAEYLTHEVSLLPGDVVVMATDGITDGLDPDDLCIGTNTMLDLIRDYRHRSAHEIMKVIVGEVRQRAGDAPLRDDMTVMILRVL